MANTKEIIQCVKLIGTKKKIVAKLGIKAKPKIINIDPSAL